MEKNTIDAVTTCSENLLLLGLTGGHDEPLRLGLGGEAELLLAGGRGHGPHHQPLSSCNIMGQVRWEQAAEHYKHINYHQTK